MLIVYLHAFYRATSNGELDDFLSNDEKRVLQENGVKFRDLFDCDDSLVAEMFAKKIIKQDKRSILLSKNIHERNDAVFTLLLKSPRGRIEKFRKILEANDQEHVANLLPS